MTAENDPPTWREWLAQCHAKANATLDAWARAEAVFTPPKPHPLTTSPEDGGNDV